MLKIRFENANLLVLRSFCLLTEQELSRQLGGKLCIELMQKKAERYEVQQLTKKIEIKLLKLTHDQAKKKFTMNLTPTQGLIIVKYQNLYEQKIKTNKSAIYNSLLIQELSSEMIRQLTNL